MPTPASPWPITIDDVRDARDRIAGFLSPTPLRRFPALDARVGADIAVHVKLEPHQPTGSFKIRNGLSLVTALAPDERVRGVVAASRGNHGLGLAWAGARLGTAVTVCVPVGNNPEKNEAMRAEGAVVREEGADYDAAAAIAATMVRESGAVLAHSTNDPRVIAGAGTMTLEMVEQEPALDAMVVAVGGGSQAVGALTVARALHPRMKIYGVQAAGAPAIHDSWHAGEMRTTASATTFADGLATRSAYAMTFPALRAGLAGFITVGDDQIAQALRLLLATTHTLVEGAGAAGLAGLLALRHELAGQRVGIILSGGNIDAETLRRVVAGEI